MGTLSNNRCAVSYCIVKRKEKTPAVRQPHGLAMLSALLEAVRLQAATNLHLHHCQTLMRPFKQLAGHVHVSHYWGGRSSIRLVPHICAPRFFGNIS